MTTYLVIALISCAVGVILSFVFYSPEQRAINRLEQIVSNEERMLRGKVSKVAGSWEDGANHMIDRLKSHIPRFATSKT
jgi:hypothetical protein